MQKGCSAATVVMTIDVIYIFRPSLGGLLEGVDLAAAAHHKLPATHIDTHKQPFRIKRYTPQAICHDPTQRSQAASQLPPRNHKCVACVANQQQAILSTISNCPGCLYCLPRVLLPPPELADLRQPCDHRADTERNATWARGTCSISVGMR